MGGGGRMLGEGGRGDIFVFPDLFAQSAEYLSVGPN